MSITSSLEGYMRRSIAVAVCLLTACGGARGYSHVPVPEDAENPTVIEFSGGTPADVVPVIAEVLSEIPIQAAQVDRSRGYVETRWFDIAQYDPVRASGYPLRERQVLYEFQVSDAEGRRRRVELTAYYQPTRPTGTSPSRDSRYDRLVPTDHPAYQLALRLANRLRIAMRSKGLEVMGSAGDQGRPPREGGG